MGNNAQAKLIFGFPISDEEIEKHPEWDNFEMFVDEKIIRMPPSTDGMSHNEARSVMYQHSLERPIIMESGGSEVQGYQKYICLGHSYITTAWDAEVHDISVMIASCDWGSLIELLHEYCDKLGIYFPDDGVGWKLVAYYG